MKLEKKPEYNENVTDVDALEKLRIQQEAETDRKLIMEQEITKREKIKQDNDTKRSDGYMYRVCWIAIACGLAGIATAITTGIEVETYMGVLKEKVELESKRQEPCPACAPPVECPKVTCQPVPVK